MIADPQDSTDIKFTSLYPARILAVQSMYSIDVLIGKKSVSQISSDYIEYHANKYPEQNLDQKYYLNLLEGTCDHLNDIDKKISANLGEGWRLERLPKLSLAILRVGSGEIILHPNSEIGLIINDYLQISKSLGHSEDTGFINGVLDKIKLRT
jgi:N utilization substance protein B